MDYNPFVAAGEHPLRHFLAKTALVVGLICLICVGPVLSFAADTQDRIMGLVQIVAPDQAATKVFSQPSPGSKVVAVAAHGEVLEIMGHTGGYVQVRLPESKGTGYVLETHTIPWQPADKPGRFPLIPVAIAVVVLAGAVVGGLLYRKTQKAKEVERRASFISASIKTAEEFFRSGDYPAAIDEFKRYLELQGGEVRDPDVYRRLSYCHLKTGEANEAALAWEKMKDRGGLKTTQDYALGVEIMTALGKEATAAEIYETLLRMEQDDERAYDIHKNLFIIYRHLKNPRKLLEHAIELISTGATEPEVYSDTVHFLIAEGATDLAIESNNKEIIVRIGQEFLEEKVMTPEAERIYLKCLSFERTDQRFHRALAEKYKKESNIRKAVGELTILHQLDKDRPDEYIEQAAKLYVENSLVSEALAEGNPKVIKKIAQIYLSRSEVTPEAVEVYERLLELQPKLVGVNKMMSTVYLTRGELQKYMAKLRLLHELDGANHDYLTDLARCVIDNDLIEKTLKEGNQELNERILKLLAKTSRQDKKGLARLEEFLKYAPDSVAALDALAKRYQEQADHTRHLETLLNLSLLKPDARGIAAQAAWIALEHNLIEIVLRKGHREVLLATALEIVARRLETPTAVQVLIRAAKESPQETRIKKYLEGRDKTQGPSAPEAVQALAPPKPVGVEAVPPPARRTVDVVPPPSKKAPVAPPKESAPTPKVSVPITPPPRPAATAPSAADEKKPSDRPHPEAAKGGTAAKPPPGQQTVQFIGKLESSSQQKQVTTFVSYHEKGLPRVQYDREELFVPASGGLAYKDLDLIGSDGWGLWHLAKEVNTERTVLLRVFAKDLLPEYAMDEFVEEVSRLSYNLAHEGILGIDEVVTGPGHSHGLICSYLPRTMEQSLQTKPIPDPGKMIAVIGKIAAAMAFACSYRGADGKVRRTYHLALQPSQILVNEDLSSVKVSGLGYALAYRNLTKGTKHRWKEPGSNPAYMPPELFPTRAGSILERAVDVYSFGIMAYLMVTGELPFEGPDPEDYRFQHTKVFPAPPSLVNPSVPEWLEGIIMQCLEKNPESRWNSSVALFDELRKHMRASTK